MQSDELTPSPSQMLVGYFRIARGLTNGAIAERLGISIKTVEHQFRQLALRLGYESCVAMRDDLCVEYHQRIDAALEQRELVTA